MTFLLPFALLLVVCRSALGQHTERIQAMWSAKMQGDADHKSVDGMKHFIKHWFSEQAKVDNS